MKLREIFRFEVAYQIRRVSTWLYFVVLAVVAFMIMGDHISNARSGEYFVNAPWLIAAVIVFLPSSLLWLLVTAAVSGDVATRDVATGMHPLTYAAPVSKVEYLGGRFLAAFVLNALILLALPVGTLLAVLLSSPGVDTEILGPLRPAAYLTAYSFIAVPSAFVATTIQFSFAVFSRRAIASYLASVLLLVVAVIVGGAFLAEGLGLWDLAKLVDPIGVIFVGELSNVWTTIEKNTRLIGFDGWLLANRLLWLGIAAGVLAVTHLRFRFSHHTATTWWDRTRRRQDAHAPLSHGIGIAMRTPIVVPQVRRTFGFATLTRQTLAITWTSFGKIVTSRAGLVMMAVILALAVLAVIGEMDLLGVPLLPRTAYVLTVLTTPQAQFGHWIIIPLLIIFWSGELVWREREAGLSELVAATPVSEWVLFLGKFVGLGLVLVVFMALLTAAGLLVQVSMGYYDFEIELYLTILFGLQLPEYLLFALLALVVHVVVNQKHVANLMAVLVFAFITGFHSMFGIEHNLLIYGAGPGWTYTEMGGFGGSVGPWLWFKLYWTAWGLVLAVGARLLWVRGRENGSRGRLGLARGRRTRSTAWVSAVAVGLLVTVGGWIFYNTNMRNEYVSSSRTAERQAAYERRYGQYVGLAQPRLEGTSLAVEIYPERGAVTIQGTYRLVNRSGAAIAAIHVATGAAVETGDVRFDRAARLEIADTEVDYRIYALEQPLEPGEALRLDFTVQEQRHGFGEDGVDGAVVANGSHITNAWLPAIGYQRGRELMSAAERRAHGLAPRSVFLSLYDVEARRDSIAKEQIAFDAVVGTSEEQVAVAPGALRRTWTAGGRRYFHYATDAPIGNEYAIFSAAYAVHEGQWHDPAGSGQVVAIRIFHHPEHTTSLDRMLRSVQASLDHYTQQFGPYRYSHISLVERPGHDLGMHAEATLIDYEEGFSLLNPEGNPRGPDLPFSVVAHEVAHQWWGSYLAHARVEGAVLLSETLAQYSAYQVVKKTYGQEHLRRVILSQLHEEEETPRTRAAVPLLRATDSFLAYRKGPLVMYTVSEYIGEDRVNEALRRLLAKHSLGGPALLTSLDLYREIQAVTPPSLHYLLYDLFEANTFWDLETERATAKQTEAGTWQVTLDVRARKVVVDEAGVETEVPMDDWVEIGIFAPAKEGEERGEPLNVQMQRLGSGTQTITMTVPHQPASVSIDPDLLLIDLETSDNGKEVEIVR